MRSNLDDYFDVFDKILLISLKTSKILKKNAFSACKTDYRAEDDVCQHCLGSGEEVIFGVVSLTAYCQFLFLVKYQKIEKNQPNCF